MSGIISPFPDTADNTHPTTEPLTASAEWMAWAQQVIVDRIHESIKLLNSTTRLTRAHRNHLTNQLLGYEEALAARWGTTEE